MKNLNVKTDGYFEIMDNGKLVSGVYGFRVRNGKPAVCKYCGRTVTNYFDTVYYDEHDDEHAAIYGVDCFKKIATFDDSVFAI